MMKLLVNLVSHNYDNEYEIFSFPLSEDLQNGDLQIIKTVLFPVLTFPYNCAISSCVCYWFLQSKH